MRRVTQPACGLEQTQINLHSPHNYNCRAKIKVKTGRNLPRLGWRSSPFLSLAQCSPSSLWKSLRSEEREGTGGKECVFYNYLCGFTNTRRTGAMSNLSPGIGSEMTLWRNGADPTGNYPMITWHCVQIILRFGSNLTTGLLEGRISVL